MTRDQLLDFLADRKILAFCLAFVGLAGTGFGLGYVAHAAFDAIFQVGFAAGYALASLLA